MVKLLCNNIIVCTVVASIVILSNTIAMKLNLTEYCAGPQMDYCVLPHIAVSFEDPLTVVDSVQSQLSILTIRDTALVRFPREIFEQAPNLVAFVMHDTGLNRISTYDFEHASRLVELVLQKNRLSTLPEMVFQGLSSVEFLLLSRNSIHTIHRMAFAGLTKLNHLDLQYNSIEQLSTGTFADLINLQQIDLSNNRIQKIDASTFSANKNLRVVLLNNNKFVVFEPNSLEHLTHLNLLDLSFSNLEELNVQSVDTLLIQNSGLKRCNVRGSIIKLHANNNELAELSIFDKLSVRELELHGNLFKSFHDFVGLTNLQRLDLSKNYITTLNTTLHSFLTPSSLTTLNLAFNQLENLYVDNFLLLQKLTQLDLAFNHFLSLPADVFKPLYNLEKFFFDGNNIRTFDYRSFLDSHLSLKEMGLSGNPWDTRFMHEMVNFLKNHEVQVLVRFPLNGPHLTTPGVIATKHNHVSMSTINPMLDVTKLPSHKEFTSESPAATWTSADTVAWITLILVFIVLTQQTVRILEEKQCLSRCYRSGTLRLSSESPRRAQRLNEEVSEV